MEKQSFERWLEYRFAERNEFGGRVITKDNVEDLFVDWLNQLDPQEFINFADEWMAEIMATK